MSETSLEFTSGLEFEFVIVISIRDSNLLYTHVLKKKKKKLSFELFFTGIIQMTIILLVCKPLIITLGQSFVPFCFALNIYKRLSNNNEIIENQSSKFNGQFAEPGSRFGVRTAKSSED